jgi:quinol monooxygenase YgiN
MTSDSDPAASVAVFCSMRPQPGRAQALRESVMALVAPTRAEPGCLTYDLHGEADGALVLHEVWCSRAELAAHQQQPAVSAFFGDRLRDLITNEVDVHSSTPLSS